MSESVNGVVFFLLAFATIGGALMMLATRNVVHAAYWLLETMLATAGLYLLLSAEFLALVQVLVYAGAVSVLVLFVIMLTLRRRSDAIRPFEPGLGGAIVAALFLGAVYLALTRFVAPAVEMPAAAPGVSEFGQIMFTEWALPFEIASLVLLVALIAAVWWSREGEDR
ncbi:MAG: NADH-quinone oxidoreductase subunit J [Coriobacteriia bacterium]